MKFENRRDMYVAQAYGIQFEVPRWAKWVAIHSTGALAVYSLKPLVDSESGFFVGDRSCYWEMLPIKAHFEETDSETAWMDSLTELNDLQWMSKLEIVE